MGGEERRTWWEGEGWGGVVWCGWVVVVGAVESGREHGWRRRRRLEVKVGERPVYPQTSYRILLQAVLIFSQNMIFIIQSVRGSPLIFLCNQLFDGLFLWRITVGEQLYLGDIFEGDDFCKWRGEIRQLVCSKPC